MAVSFAPSSATVMLFTLFVISVFVGLANSAKFDQFFEASWAQDHMEYDGEKLDLKLDTYSGAGFVSKSKYLFGRTSVQIKLVEGDSAGIVTAFYMSSDGPKHNEFDFEFLGNTTGEPYLVQTNIYVNGVGNREERLSLWFDPSKEFHTYSILWNQKQVVFMVDETPIRNYVNREKEGIPFPKDQAMGVYSSIWNADDWATQGGRVKTDWSHAPFVASYKGFEIDGCECPAKTAAQEYTNKCSSSENKYWWDEPMLSALNVHQSHQLLWVRNHHLIYDYCTDSTRFTVAPLECGHRRHY